MIATMSPQSPGYVVGEPHPNRDPCASFETKPSPVDYTGGGYEHWRSHEFRPETPGTRKEDVYVSHHRLLAVVACYDVEIPLRDVLDDLAEKDVHHTTGVPWANFGDSPNFDEPGIEVVDHGRHSEITQTQRRAWAADKKQEVESAEQQPLAADDSTCDRCGDEVDVLAECDTWPDEERCIECANETAEGEEIRL